MKKMAVLTSLLVLVASNIAFGITWHTANQTTVGWDPVTTLANGDPIPAGDSLEYVAYLANSVTDPDKSNPVEVGAVSSPFLTITLNTEGYYYVGIKVVRKLGDGTIVGESAIAWSDDPQYATSGEFGIRYFLPPAMINSLGRK